MANHKIIFDHYLTWTPVSWKRQGATGKFRWRDVKQMHKAKQSLGWEVKAAEPKLRLDGNARFGFRAIFYIRHRADGDRLVNLLTDALEGIVWENDEQVEEGSFRKKLEIDPGLQLIIYRIET